MWIKAIYQLIITIPAILDIYDRVSDLITQYKVNQIKEKYGRISSERDALILAIGRAETNEERLLLTSAGYRLSRDEMPEP